MRAIYEAMERANAQYVHRAMGAFSNANPARAAVDLANRQLAEAARGMRPPARWAG